MTNEYIALDFETTGLDPKKSEIVEIGAVRFRDDGEILDTFQSLAKPSKNIPQDVQEVHGISNEMVKDMDPPRVVWDKFLAWAGDFKALVAHNAEFESLFIQELYDRGEISPDIGIFDTLHLSRKRIVANSYKLSDLVDELGNNHRALEDAQACVTVFMRAAETYKSGKVPASNMKSVKHYDYVTAYSPSKKQLDYIKSLGGNPRKVKTKKEASTYIDQLKSGQGFNAGSSKTRPGKTQKQSSPAGTIILVLIVIVILVFIIAE